MGMGMGLMALWIWKALFGHVPTKEIDSIHDYDMNMNDDDDVA